MTDRETLTLLIDHALHDPANVCECGCGETDSGLIADAVLAKYTLIEGPLEPNPPWLGGMEYGVRENGVVYPARDQYHARGEAERRRWATKHRTPPVNVEAVQREVLPFARPWMPVPDPKSSCSDCGYPEGRQGDCFTCHGRPIPEEKS